MGRRTSLREGTNKNANALRLGGRVAHEPTSFLMVQQLITAHRRRIPEAEFKLATNPKSRHVVPV